MALHYNFILGFQIVGALAFFLWIAFTLFSRHLPSVWPQ